MKSTKVVNITMKTSLHIKQFITAGRVGRILLGMSIVLSVLGVRAQSTTMGPNSAPTSGFPSWCYPNATNANNVTIGRSTTNTGPYYLASNPGSSNYIAAVVSSPILYAGPGGSLSITTNFDVDVQDAPGNTSFTSANIICYYYVSNTQVSPCSINWVTNSNSFLQSSFNFITGGWQSKSGSFTTNPISPGQYVYFMLTTNTAGNAPYLLDNVRFTINGFGVPLSVGYSQNLTATQKNANSILLNWATGTENNNKGFWAQRSINNGKEWKDLDFIPTNAKSGNSAATLNYSYTDVSPSAGENAYRLKQVDLDGATSYSNTVNITYSGTTSNSNPLLITPNPVESTLNIQGTPVNNATYRIVNISGQVVKQSTLGDSRKISVAGLSAGIYFLQVQSNGGIQSIKFIKK